MNPETRARIAGIVKAALVAFAVAWITVPIVISYLYAFSSPSDYYDQNKVVPTRFTLEQLRDLIALGAGSAIANSVIVASMTVLLSFTLGLPAGYALARYTFRGRDTIKLAMIATRMFPVVVIAVPLLVLYIRVGLSDSLVGVALAHTSMALPFVVLITSSIFAGIPRDLEEAGLVFGLDGKGVFFSITLPMAAPGLAAAAIFAFLLSWNEVFVASILTLTNRTLPAFVLVQAQASTDLIKFAATVLIVTPALVFVALARRYLVTMWGVTLR